MHWDQGMWLWAQMFQLEEWGWAYREALSVEAMFV
jgi:hypothetical protein